MADQQQSWATTCGGAPPELDGLQIGDRFVQTADLRVATERCFLAACVQINAWGDLVESFIAAMALYSTSKVKLRKLEAAML